MKVIVKLIKNTGYPCPCSAGTLDLCIIETDGQANGQSPRVEFFICSICGKQIKPNNHHESKKYLFQPASQPAK